MPRIRYCRTPAGRVAYSTVGAGPPLLCDSGWVTHLTAQLELFCFDRFIEGLAERYTVIRYDKPGCGLSDRDGADLSFDRQVAAALAVADAVGANHFSLFGASQGGQLAVAIAAACPDRVDALVLYGTCASGADLAPPEIRESIVALVRAHWGLGSKMLTGIFIPDPAPEDVDALTRLTRVSASADVASRLLEEYYETDVRALLPGIRARTAVLHREADPATRFELGREVATLIPGATLVPLPGPGHLFYYGDWTAVLNATLGFLGGSAAGEPRLTGRELEVAGLVAEGLTNHAIARRLSVAPRTAEAHVENIRRKLGVRSRAQIAAWVTEHRSRPGPRRKLARRDGPPLASSTAAYGRGLRRRARFGGERGREFGVAPGEAGPARRRDRQPGNGARSRARVLGPLAQPPPADGEAHQHLAGPSAGVEVASVHGGDPLRAGHPVQRADLAVYPARELEGQGLGGVLAKLLQLAPDPGDGFRLAPQDRAQGAQERLAVGRADATRPREAELHAAKVSAGIGQRQDPVQRGHRLPGPQAAEVGAEVPYLAGGLPVAGHRESGRGRPLVQPDVDHVFLAARRPVPRRQRGLQQVAFQPGGLVRRVAADRLDPGHPRHHRGQVAAVAQVRPVRGHPGTQRGRPADVEDRTSRVPEPVDPRPARQARDRRGSPPSHQVSREGSETAGTRPVCAAMAGTAGIAAPAAFYDVAGGDHDE